MNLADRLAKDYVAAYKARDAARLSVLRLLKTAMANRLVELKKPGQTLADAEITDLIHKQAKQRRDSIEQYLAAKRPDLAEKEEAELAILKEYLPQPLSEAELAEAIGAAIAEAGAKGPSDMGRVVGAVMAKHKGRVDGKAVSELVRARLASGLPF